MIIMEKPIAALEISSKSIKLVVGYELKGQVYVIYTLCKKLNNFVSPGNIENRQEIIESLSSLSKISDPSARLNLSFGEAMIAVPPYGLEVYQVQQTTSVISSEQKVCDVDINNVYNIIRNGVLPVQNNELVDIVPNFYYLDNDRVYNRPPYGETSRQVSIVGKVHTLPKNIANCFTDLVRNSGIKVKRNAVAPFAAMELLSTYPETPENYILVDIGSNVTTVSLAGNKQLFASRYFKWGGDNITEHIIECFNINEADAEKIKTLYGIDYRSMSFKTHICSSEDGAGSEIKYYPEDLNKIIKEELDLFVKQLNEAIDNLTAEYGNEYKKLPLILIGGGSKLNGLVQYITPKVPSDSVMTVSPKSLGARDPSLFNCLGMIYTNSRYPVAAVDENQLKVGIVSRETK